MKKSSKKMILKPTKYKDGSEKLYGIGKDKLEGRPSSDTQGRLDVKPSTDSYNTGLSKEERMSTVGTVQTSRHPKSQIGAVIKNNNNQAMSDYKASSEAQKIEALRRAKASATPNSTIGKVNTGGTGSMTPKQIENITPAVETADQIAAREKARIQREKGNTLAKGAKKMMLYKKGSKKC